MFGFSLATQLFQGSAQRTWNCVTQFTNLLWYKFNHIRHPIMPRSRRRHHSRSRSRSRSHSHDRDRDVKRRKIDSVESPSHKKSVSEPSSPASPPPPTAVDETNDKSRKQLEEKLTITPKKTMSPKQLAKKLESEKKRKEKQMEREERERQKQEMKLKQKQEKEEMKQKKNEQKVKEREMKEEQKRKEKEEKEAKRKEKEEREEAKRMEKLKKQQEIDEKNKEKQKLEEQKQKTAQAFKSFFVPKKHEMRIGEEEKHSIFMPFQVKTDMRLAPICRVNLSDDAKKELDEFLNNEKESKGSYLSDLKRGKAIGKSYKTWPYEEDVMIVDEDFGESICEEKQKVRVRAKFFKFKENQRPPYYGTWRKKSGRIGARRPFVEDTVFFDYDVDSDDDWEEEEQGESLNGSDDEEKENEVENDDYEVDNEFFVPHGHLSDDEVDDETISKLSPESQKQKLKLLKDEFDQDMLTKTNKMKPRSIGCIWYDKNGSNVDETIDRYLRPFAAIANGQIVIKKRSDLVVNNTPSRKMSKELQQDLIPAFLKLIHGNGSRKQVVINDFIDYMQNNGYVVEVSKSYLVKQVKKFAQYKKCGEEGPFFNKFCWCVDEDVRKKYNLE